MHTLIIAACVAWLTAVAYWIGFGRGRQHGKIEVSMRSIGFVVGRRCD